MKDSYKMDGRVRGAWQGTLLLHDLSRRNVIKEASVSSADVLPID